MYKDKLQKLYNLEKEKETSIDNAINKNHKELNKLKLIRSDTRIKINLVMSIILLLITSKSSLFFLVAKQSFNLTIVSTILFGVYYAISDFAYKYIINKKYDINLSKKNFDKESIEKEIECNIELEKYRNKKIYSNNIQKYLDKKIKLFHNGMPLFSKYSYLDNKVLKDRTKKLDSNIKDNKKDLSKDIENYALNNIANKYSLKNSIISSLKDILIGAGVLSLLPLLNSGLLISFTQIYLGILMLTIYSANKSNVYNSAKEVFKKHDINLLKIKKDDNLKDKIYGENNKLYNNVVEKIETNMVYDSVKDYEHFDYSTHNYTMENINLDYIENKSKKKILERK